MELADGLAITVGVLVGVPVMLGLVGVANRTKCWFDTAADQATALA